MGKNFRKNRKEIAKVEKNCKNFGEIFQKIVEIFQKIVEIFQKNSKKIPKKFWKNLQKLPKTSPPTYKSARNPKSFSSRIA